MHKETLYRQTRLLAGMEPDLIVWPEASTPYALNLDSQWVEELVNENYLHNHTRMWFASIWIFTLNLPWQLGANFFMRHLLDGDSASNTLSWRWVAGLQTIGKHYLATASNISKFTNNVHKPQNLNEDALPLNENKTYDLIDINYTTSEQSSDTHLIADNNLSLKNHEDICYLLILCKIYLDFSDVLYE